MSHGQSYSREYKSWCQMKQRCLNEKSPDYPHYGGSGITICQEWIDSYEAFFEALGERPEGTTLDRIDSRGNYEPSNCRWADAETQNLNRRGWKRPKKFGGFGSFKF